MMNNEFQPPRCDVCKDIIPIDAKRDHVVVTGISPNRRWWMLCDDCEPCVD